MVYGRLYTPSGGRWLPVDGGPAVLPPDVGDDGGGGQIGNVNAMLVGAASANLSGSDFAALDAAAGPFTVRRSYDDALPATFAASAAGIDVAAGRASVHSCKPPLDQLASGALDGAIRAFVASIPPTHVTWLTVWHEPDHKIRTDVFTLAQYLPAFTRWCQVVKDAVTEFGFPHIYTAQIVEAWSGSHPKAGTTYADMWPGDGLVDTFSLDGYSNEGTGAAVWGAGVAFARAKGIPWAISELGCAGTMDPTWMTDQAAYAGAVAGGGRHTRAAYLCWFSNVTGGVLATPGDDPAAQAASKAVAQTYFTDVNAYLL